MFKVNNKDTRMTPLASFWCFYCQLIVSFYVNFNIKALLKKSVFSINDFFSKCDQNRRKLRIWSHLLTKLLMENFIFCAMNWYDGCRLFTVVAILHKNYFSNFDLNILGDLQTKNDFYWQIPPHGLHVYYKVVVHENQISD